MNRLSCITLGVLLSTSVFAQQDTRNPLDPQYKPPSYSDIHNGGGNMSQAEYMKYCERTWTDAGSKTIDKSNPRYSEYQMSPRFGLMDKNGDGAISQEEYMAFHEKAWNDMKHGDPLAMSQEEYKQSYSDTRNPLHPSFKREM